MVHKAVAALLKGVEDLGMVCRRWHPIDEATTKKLLSPEELKSKYPGCSLFLLFKEHLFALQVAGVTRGINGKVTFKTIVSPPKVRLLPVIPALVQIAITHDEPSLPSGFDVFCEDPELLEQVSTASGGLPRDPDAQHMVLHKAALERWGTLSDKEKKSYALRGAPSFQSAQVFEKGAVDPFATLHFFGSPFEPKKMNEAAHDAFVNVTDECITGPVVLQLLPNNLDNTSGSRHRDDDMSSDDDDDNDDDTIAQDCADYAVPLLGVILMRSAEAPTSLGSKSRSRFII